MLTQFRKWKGERQLSFRISKSLKSLSSPSSPSSPSSETKFDLSKLSDEIRTGNQDVFSKIYHKFRKPIFSYFKGKLRSQDIAEELTQEVFLKVYRFRSTYDSQFEFSTWIWAIAKNTLADWLRKNRKGNPTGVFLDESQASSLMEVEEMPCKRLDPELSLIGSEDQEALLKMLSSLTELQKKALFMRLIHRWTYQEIGKHLNLSLSAVKSLLHRAKATLVNQLGKRAEVLT